jgi:NADPH-dependent 2,4-dienoyl-CoA reductase/sulfur reductase-like enzyme/rhodanese-related sulfurtransferase
MKTLIIGGVAGGATAAARLRRLDENAEIILFERGEYISFANCGLPYYIGGEITDRDELILQTPDSFNRRFNIDVRTLNEVLSIDRKHKNVAVANLRDGSQYSETYDKLILSPGAAPWRPPIFGADSPRVFTLRSLPDTFEISDFIAENKPRSALVLGGGYIGVEMAENLHRAGLKVTIVELSDQVIAPLDFEMACIVHNHLRSRGVELILNNAVKAVADDGVTLTITLDEGEVKADILLLSAGIRPESALAVDAGLEVNPRGFIETNSRMLTSDPDIYAVGDAVEITDFVTGAPGAVALAGPANKQGRVAADNICGVSAEYTGTQGSSILKVFDLTVATTGSNEKILSRLDLPYDKSFTVSGSHAGYYPGSQSMTIKTLFDPKDGKILGAQIVGADGADKRCDVIATAIRFGATAYDLTRLELCYAPPYSSAKDPVNMAGFVIENLLDGRLKNFHWHDVSALDPDAVTLLDVRTAAEFSRGAIPGFINIPLDELRARHGELDPKKPVYAMCQVGLRGYIASRILTGRGFKVYNLSGGYALWSCAARVTRCPR